MLAILSKILESLLKMTNELGFKQAITNGEGFHERADHLLALIDNVNICFNYFFFVLIIDSIVHFLNSIEKVVSLGELV